MVDRFDVVGQSIDQEWTSTGWMLNGKRRKGSGTLVVGTTVATAMLLWETYNLSVTGTVRSTSTMGIPNGQLVGEIEVRCTVAASTPNGSISGAFKSLAGAATTSCTGWDLTTDYFIAISDGSAWLVLFSNGVAFS